MKARVSRHAGLRVVASALLAPWMVQATCISVQAQSTPARGGPARPQAQPKATAVALGQLNLQLRRQPGMLQVVVEGAGSAPELQQSASGNAWQGLLVTNGNPGLRQGVQQFSAPEAGIQSISLSGSGNRYQIDVQGLPRMALPRPQVSADGLNLIVSFPTTGQAMSSTANFDLNQPGRLPQPSFAPPLQPRAVAPPVGDMAVGTMMLANTSFVRLSGPKITMTLRNAPAKDVLMSLARLGNYGYVFVEDSGSASASVALAAGGSSQAGSTTPGTSPAQTGLPVNVSFINEDYSRAVNAVLMASGLAAKLEGRVLMVGSNIFSKSFAPKLSKIYRLNQVAPGSAADYLANLGASVTKTNTITTSVSQGASESSAVAGAPSSSTTQTATETIVETYGASVGPLLGLQATTDSRLGTITLIGDPALVLIAENYLRQLDLRQRQVAVKVQILNVDLDNDKQIDASFSARIGDTFIVSESGKAFINFGDNLPGGSSGTGLIGQSGSPFVTPGSYEAGIPRVQAQSVLPPVVEAQKEVVGSNGTVTLRPLLDSEGRRIFVPSTNPNEPDVLIGIVDEFGRPVLVSGQDASEYRQPNNTFYEFLEAAIVSSSVKTLSQPTLLVQEGQKAQVKTATSVITGVQSTEAANGSVQFTNTRKEAGLVLDIAVPKIDDNGFVTLDLKPSVSVPIPAGTQQGVPIFNISERSLSSGLVRLRDGQTLVLTGVIQDSDRQIVRKWPILGDMPLIGQMFRQSGSSRQKNELVIIVTPTVINDDQGGLYGYGYRPSGPAAQVLSR